jgi:hypothetical protein
MGETLTADWKEAKAEFEAITGKKKPSEKFLGFFRKPTGIEKALEEYDKAFATKDTAGMKKGQTSYTKAMDEYMLTLDEARTYYSPDASVEDKIQDDGIAFLIYMLYSLKHRLATIIGVRVLHEDHQKLLAEQDKVFEAKLDAKAKAAYKKSKEAWKKKAEAESKQQKKLHAEKRHMFSAGFTDQKAAFEKELKELDGSRWEKYQKALLDSKAIEKALLEMDTAYEKRDGQALDKATDAFEKVLKTYVAALDTVKPGYVPEVAEAESDVWGADGDFRRALGRTAPYGKNLGKCLVEASKRKEHYEAFLRSKTKTEPVAVTRLVAAFATQAARVQPGEREDEERQYENEEIYHNA